jgi:hypothetical protein
LRSPFNCHRPGRGPCDQRISAILSEAWIDNDVTAYRSGISLDASLKLPKEGGIPFDGFLELSVGLTENEECCKNQKG